MRPVNSFLRRSLVHLVGAALTMLAILPLPASEAPPAAWATFLTGAREGVALPKILPDANGGFYFYSAGDRPLIKFNGDGSVAWEIRQEPGVNDVREFVQMDVLANGDFIAIVAADSNKILFGQQVAGGGRFLVQLRASDAAPVFVKAIENCWITSVKARPGGGFFLGGVNWDVARIGGVQLPISANHVFLTQFTKGLDWIATGDLTDLNDSIEAIRTTGSGASLRIYAVGNASKPFAFGGRSFSQAGAYIPTLDAQGTVLNVQLTAPDERLCAFEMRPGGGFHFAAAKTGATSSDLWRLNADLSVASHASVDGLISGLAAADQAYVVGTKMEVGFLASFDVVGNQVWRRDESNRSGHLLNGVALLTDGRLAIAGVARPSGVFLDDFFLRDFNMINVAPFGGTVAVLETRANAEPVFRAQPKDQNLAVRGETITLHADVFSASGVALEWYKDGNVISGATSSDLVLQNVQGVDSGTYALQARNSAGLTRSRDVSVVVNTVSVSLVPGTDTPGALDAPRSPVVLPDGSILIADTTKNAIRRVNGGVVTTFAGSGQPSLANGTPLDAMFSSPTSLAIESRYDGPMVYVADRGNNALRRIRFLAETGAATLVEQIGSSLLAPNALATLDGLRSVVIGSEIGSFWKFDDGNMFPFGGVGSVTLVSALALDARNNLYGCDPSAGLVRRFGADGSVAIVAASLNAPSGIVLDDSGNIYVTERDSNSISKISPSGTKTVIAGAGSSFNAPEGLCFNNGSLIVADTGNHCLRQISFTPLSPSDAGPPQLHFALGASLSITISGAPGNTFTIESSAQIGPAAQWKTEGTVTVGSGAALNLPKPAATRFYRARK